jgi:hypothetical protein
MLRHPKAINLTSDLITTMPYRQTLCDKALSRYSKLCKSPFVCTLLLLASLAPLEQDYCGYQTHKTIKSYPKQDQTAWISTHPAELRNGHGCRALVGYECLKLLSGWRLNI